MALDPLFGRGPGHVRDAFFPNDCGEVGKALSLADEMLLTSPMGLRLTKDALNLNIDAASMEHAFGLEDRQQILLSQTADSVEARNAFLEKRAPQWQNR